jgi:hypothetical protein
MNGLTIQKIERKSGENQQNRFSRNSNFSIDPDNELNPQRQNQKPKKIMIEKRPVLFLTTPTQRSKRCGGGQEPGVGVGWGNTKKLKKRRWNMEREEEVKAEIKEENIAKIAITKEADRAIVDLVARVNDGFDAGKASKQEVTSHAILNFCKTCTESEIYAIRELFFNPIALMEATLRRAKETGEIPDSLREILFQQFVSTSGNGHSAKKSKKSLKSDALNESISSKDGAA